MKHRVCSQNRLCSPPRPKFWLSPRTQHTHPQEDSHPRLDKLFPQTRIAPVLVQTRSSLKGLQDRTFDIVFTGGEPNAQRGLVTRITCHACGRDRTRPPEPSSGFAFAVSSLSWRTPGWRQNGLRGCRGRLFLGIKPLALQFLGEILLNILSRH